MGSSGSLSGVTGKTNRSSSRLASADPRAETSGQPAEVEANTPGAEASTVALSYRGSLTAKVLES